MDGAPRGPAASWPATHAAPRAWEVGVLLSIAAARQEGAWAGRRPAEEPQEPESPGAAWGLALGSVPPAWGHFGENLRACGQLCSAFLPGPFSSTRVPCLGGFCLYPLWTPRGTPAPLCHPRPAADCPGHLRTSPGLRGALWGEQSLSDREELARDSSRSDGLAGATARPP